MSISLPKSRQAGVDFVISTDDELQEKLAVLSDDFPVSVYTQSYRHDACDQIPFHWHETMQVTWISQGELAYSVNGESFILGSGQLIFVKDRQLHSSHTVRQDVKTLCINFRTGIFQELILKHYISPLLENPAFSYRLLTPEPYQIQKLKSFLPWGDSAPGYFSVINFLSQMFEEFLKESADTGAAPDTAELRLFQEALDYIHLHYAEPLSIEELARHISVNKNLLHELFRRYTNMSPIRCLNEYRLYTARNLILHSGRSVSEIAADVGYNHVSHFIQQFSEHYGLTPLRFRKRYGNP